jgi:hypothetical protein
VVTVGPLSGIANSERGSKPSPAVALQVLRVARLEVGREVLGVDELEVLREQLFADALPAMDVVRRDEAEVVVRLVVRVRVLEPEQPFEHDSGPVAQ